MQNSEESPGKDMEFPVAGLTLKTFGAAIAFNEKQPVDMVATAEGNTARELHFRGGNVSKSGSPCGKGHELVQMTDTFPGTAAW